MKKSLSGPLRIHSFPNSTGQGDRRTVHEATYIIKVDQDGINFIKNRWGSTGRMSKEELVEFCVNILTENQFRNFNIFRKVFEDDLRKAIGGVVNFHTMRTSSNNFRKFVRKMKERGCNIS